MNALEYFASADAPQFDSVFGQHYYAFFRNRKNLKNCGLRSLEHYMTVWKLVGVELSKSEDEKQLRARIEPPLR